MSWKKIMNYKYNSLIENNIWKFVFKPTHKKILCNKWIYKVNYKPNDNIEKFKVCNKWIYKVNYKPNDNIEKFKA